MSVLAFENVNGKSRRFALKDVSFSLEPGFIYAVAGENGAGKSTLMKYILSEKKLYSGNLIADDYFKDLIISGNRLYSKEGKLHNNTTLTEYTVFKDNLYAIIDYKPYIYNIEKNSF